MDEVGAGRFFSFGKYSCTDVIQVEDIINCPKPIGGILCCGAYYKFRKCYGCIEDENGGLCKGEKMISYTYQLCVNSPTAQSSCLIKDEITTRYIRACACDQ